MASAEQELSELRRRNAELERQVQEGKGREERLKWELEHTRERLRVVEEAEERLCLEIAELEAEAIAHARAYHLRVTALSEQLVLFQAILSSAGIDVMMNSPEHMNMR